MAAPATPLPLDEGRPPSPVSLRPVAADIPGDDARAPVLLIDPRPLTRACLALWLQAGPRGFRAVALPGPDEVAADPGRFGDARLIVLGIGGAAVSEAPVLDAVGLLGRRLPGVPLVLVAERAELTQVAAALRLGVRGYLTPSLSPAVAVEALRLVLAGGTFIPADVVTQAAQRRLQDDGPPPPRDGFDGLTPREVEVLERLRRGLSNKVIAYELAICEDTVKVHITHIMRKLGATNRTQAALLACRRLGDPD